MIDTMAQSNHFFRECFIALDLSSILSKDEKYKVSKSDDVGSRADAGSYDKLVADIRARGARETSRGNGRARKGENGRVRKGYDRTRSPKSPRLVRVAGFHRRYFNHMPII